MQVTSRLYQSKTLIFSIVCSISVYCRPKLCSGTVPAPLNPLFPSCSKVRLSSHGQQINLEM